MRFCRAALLVLLAAGLGAGAAAAAAARPDLVLITLDTTRADRLGAWGWPHARTPNLDALAARGTRFARCDAAVPVTLPSHATILTGLYPPRHGVRDNATFVLPAAAESVAERLAAGGYDTAAVVSAVVLARHFGLGQGFRLYDDDLGGGYTGGETSERPAAETTRAALAVLGRLRRPFFLWVHYFDPHEPYAPPPEVAAAARGPQPLYDGEIAYMDREIGTLLGALPPEAVVLVVGDHGEMLGEGGELTHGLLLNHGARRVPLLLAGPGIPAGRTVDCLVRTADVAPTLLRLAGLEVPAGLDGEDLLGLLGSGAACSRLSYAESFLPFFAYRWYPLRALGDDRWLYVHGPQRSSLYDLQEDPREGADLAPGDPATAAAWEGRLRQLLAGLGESLETRVRQDNPLSAADRARLESLGYLGGSAAAGTVRADLPDPRQMTDVARDLYEAAGAVRAGRFEAALPQLRAILARDPNNLPALNLAGLSLMQGGRLQSALNAFQRASEINPEAAAPVANAGHCLLQLGRRDEAVAAYRRALDLDPTSPEAASNLARLLREAGDATGAAAVIAAAFAAGSHHPGLYLERGVAAAEAGDLAAAYGDFREAARRDPANPTALDNAAKAAVLLGRFGEAAAAYEDLLGLVPERPDLWAALGGLYLDKLADREQARRCFRRALELETDPARRAQLEAVLRQLEP